MSHLPSRTSFERPARALASFLLLSSLGCAIETTPLMSADGAGQTDDEHPHTAHRAGDSGEVTVDGDGSSAGDGVDQGDAASADAGPTSSAVTSRPSTRDGGRGLGSVADAGSQPPARSDAGSAAPVDELEALRQLCVDEINRYRALVNAPPVVRATDREACSDRGAQADGDSGRAHGSAMSGVCPAGAQNTCPGWPVGGRSGNADVASALKGCLKMMWEEGPPPSASCTGACYQQHGHYLNMSARGTKRVACGFYRMKNGNYWMNQNFW